MIPDVITGLIVTQGSNIAYQALAKAIEAYRTKKGTSVAEETDDTSIVMNKVIDASTFTPEQIKELLSEINRATRDDETPIEASRSTREIINSQLTILEQERNRLIPIAGREHWVALIFAIIAGIVFFTSIGLFIFATVTKGVAVFVAGALPGFLSKIFFSREAIAEARLKEIASDLRESEKAKERLEILEEALKVIPEEYRARVLEEFTKSNPVKPASAKKF